MRKVARLLITATCAFVVLAALGCGEGDLHETDSGGVVLVVSDFDGLPIAVSVSGSGGAVTIDSLTLQSIIANQSAASSNLMDIEIRSYEVQYSRGDTGTRLPPALVQPSIEYVPVGGSTDIGNLPILLSPQLGNLPLSDLANFGIDRETGSAVVVLNLRLRFFGRTLGGRDVATEPRTFQVEFRP